MSEIFTLDKRYVLGWSVRLPSVTIPENKVKDIVDKAKAYLRNLSGNTTFEHEYAVEVKKRDIDVAGKGIARVTDINIRCRFRGIPSDQAMKYIHEAQMLEAAKKAAADEGAYTLITSTNDKASA